jgi:hypothetical protein
MVKIPKKEDSQYSTAYLLNNTRIEKEKRSQRLGMASLGEECARKMWLNFRWARMTSINRRIDRLFSFGNSVEERAIHDLEEIGITITDRQKPLEGWGGHIFGFIDGIAINVPEAPKTPHLLEVKSHNERNYNALVKNGVKSSHIKHYVQCMMYMGKLKITRALYVAVNKNNSEAHVERIHFDENEYREYMARGMDVVSHENSPPNIFNDSKKQVCKFCDFVPVCYENEPYLKSCRTCVRVSLEDGGKWSCDLHNKQLTYQEQIDACDQYRSVK